MASGVYLSIEAGDSVVKVCSISSKGKTTRLEKAFMFRTPVGTVSDGMITDPSLLAEKFTEKVSEHGLTSIKNAVFTIASGKVATREVTIPPVKENKIKAVLDANMSEHFPMDISKYQVDYGMVRQSTEGETKGLTLTLMAAPMTIIDSYVKFAREAGLIIDAIDYAGNSQFQLMKSLGNKKVSMYINIDCQYSFVTIVQNDALVFQRMLPYGGNEFIEAYRDAADDNLDYVDALRASCVSKSEMKRQGILTEEAIEDSLSRVVSGITRSMDFFGTLRWKDPLEEVILLGTCARLAGLRDMVAEATGHDYVSYLEEHPSASILGPDAHLISSYVSAYGASISSAKLLPEQYAAGKDGSGNKQKEASPLAFILPIAIGVIIAAVGGVLAYMSANENRDLTAERDRIKQEIELARPIEQVEALYYQYIRDAEKYERLDNRVLRDMNNAGLVKFFEELERKMPSELWMLSAVCTNDGVVMSLKVLSKEAVAKVLVEFRSFDTVTIVGISSVTEDIDETGTIVYSFNINYEYYIEPEPDPDAAPPPQPVNNDDDLLA